jgi:parallel beta-helix repeat protein
MALWLFSKRWKLTLHQHRGRTKPSFKPSLECLEDRRTPATLHVGLHPGEFVTIQAAVNAADSGDKIQVDPGTYQEQVTINKSIELEGHDDSTMILAPANLVAPTAANPDAIVRVLGSRTNAEIEHFTIEGALGGTANLLFGVRVDSNAFADIEHNHITNIVDSSNPLLGVAIDVGNSSNSPGGGANTAGSADIENNCIDNYQRAGVVVNHSGSSAQIENNNITASSVFHADSQTGVEVSDNASAEIENNCISGNTNNTDGSGILLFNAGSETEVENNEIANNDYGIFGSKVTSRGDEDCHMDDNDGVSVTNNQILDNTFVGIEFDNSSGVSIDNNHLRGNGSGNVADGGIYLFQSTNNELSNNQSQSNNGSGIYIDGGSTGNSLRNNQFSNSVYSVSGQSADAVDLSSGNGTAATANSWVNNQGSSFITNSGESVFKHDSSDHSHDQNDN